MVSSSAPSLSPALSPAQIEQYETDGYLHLGAWVDDAWLTELRAASAEFIEASRSLTKSSKILDLDDGHTAEHPRLRRLVSPVDRHESFQRFALAGPAAHLACQLLGGPARYHHSKLNYKWSGGGAEVKWHQDIQFWPHTDFSPLTIGVYLDDVDAEMGPMGVLGGSHRGRLYDMYAEDGSWAGALNDDDVATLDLDSVTWLDGPAGSVTVHNCAMIHGSQPNQSDRARPLLLQTYSALDSYPVAGIGANGATGRSGGTIVNGGAANQQLTIDGRSMHGAPDWSRTGAPTLFASQSDDAG